MKRSFWRCEVCKAEIEVEPMETSQYRAITCEKCGAVFAVLSAELMVKESPTGQA